MVLPTGSWLYERPDCLNNQGSRLMFIQRCNYLPRAGNPCEDISLPEKNAKCRKYHCNDFHGYIFFQTEFYCVNVNASEKNACSGNWHFSIKSFWAASTMAGVPQA